MTIAALEIPPGVPSDGRVRVDFVAAGGFANYRAATLAELLAATASNLSCFLFGIGESATEERKEKRRLCSTQKYELLGSTTYTIDDLSYVYDVQNPGSLTNEAYEALKQGTTGYLVIRWGLLAGDAFAAGQVIDIYPVRLGAQRKQAPEENDELTVLQSVVVTGDKVTDYVIPAAA